MGQSVEGVEAPPLPTVPSTCPVGSTPLTGEGLGWCNNGGKIKFNDAYKGRGYDGPGGFVCQSPDWSSISSQNDLFQKVTVEASTNYQITYEVKPRYYAAPMSRKSRASNGGVYVWFGDTMPAMTDKDMHNKADFWMYVPLRRWTGVVCCAVQCVVRGLCGQWQRQRQRQRQRQWQWQW